MGEVMSPKIVLGAGLSNGLPPLPPSLGGAPVWSEVTPFRMGSRDAWEFRHPQAGRCLVLQLVESLPDGKAVYVAWVPSDSRAGANPVFAQLAPVLAMLGTLTAYWDCELSEDWSLRPLLDESPASALVQAHWPSDWRVRMPSDSPGDPLNGIPPGTPSGPLIVGEVLE